MNTNPILTNAVNAMTKVLTALSVLTPETIAAAGAELSKQLAITEQMQKDYDAAAGTIAQAQEAMDKLAERQKEIDAEEKALQEQRDDIAARLAAVEQREKILDANLDAYAKNAAKLKADQDELASDRASLARRTAAVSIREDAAQEKENNLVAHHDTIKKWTKNLAATGIKVPELVPLS